MPAQHFPGTISDSQRVAQSDRTAKLLLCVTDKRVKRSNLLSALAMIDGFLSATDGIFRDMLSRDSGPVLGFGN